MSGLAELVQAREDVIRAALDVLVAERGLSDERASAQAVMDAEERLAVTAERLVRAIDEMPMRKRPKGWGG